VSKVPKELHGVNTVFVVDEDRVNKEDIDVVTYEQRDTSKQLHDYAMMSPDWVRWFCHRFVAHRLEKEKVEVLVDFCCATGVIMRALRRWTPSLKLYLGVDLDGKKLEKLGQFWGFRTEMVHKTWEEMWRFRYDTIEMRVDDLELWPGPDEVDAITYLFSIEHMRKDMARNSLREAHGLLKKGGLFFVTFPNNSYKQNIMKSQLEGWKYTEACETVRKAGFLIESAHGLNCRRGDVNKNPVFKRLRGQWLPDEIVTAAYAFDRPEFSDEFLIVAKKGRGLR